MKALLVRVGAWTCALPIGAVVETMRALEIHAVAGAPPFVRGFSAVRGALIPVLDLGAILDARGIDARDSDTRAGGACRLVSLRAGKRHVAVAVDEVLGIRRLDPASLERTPPLLSEALPACVAHLGSLDGQMLAVLEASRLVPDDLWASLRGTSA